MPAVQQTATMPGPEIAVMTERWTRLVMETTASDVMGGVRLTSVMAATRVLLFGKGWTLGTK
eukprot:COSAG01_NODE_1700_length_9448_cov_53.589475_4_plen_62_part_00